MCANTCLNRSLHADEQQVSNRFVVFEYFRPLQSHKVQRRQKFRLRLMSERVEISELGRLWKEAFLS